MIDYKKIHIGSHIKKVAEINELSIIRACTFLKCSHQDILDMYNSSTLDSGVLLRWCKLLDYNFFMFYHTHLQLYKPAASTAKLVKKSTDEHHKAYVMRKNLYSPELIEWLLHKLDKKELSIKEIIENYNIPKTTIYRWKKKLNNKKNMIK